MNKNKIQKGWAIVGPYGLYVGWWLKRYEAIGHHKNALGRSWKECLKKGDRAVKVEIKIV